MNDLIQRITNAIFRQEGMGPTYTNPGNLRGAPWLNQPKVSGGYWHPPNRATGIAGAAHVVALHVAQGDSLSQLIEHWAPVKDGNPTAQYVQNVKLWAAIPDEHQPLTNFIIG